MTRTIKVGRKSVRTLAMLAALPLAAVGALGAATLASASSPAWDGFHKVTICHRTGAEEGGNTHGGYSIITVDVASILGETGHDSHNQVGNGPIGDVIPSFTYTNKDGVATFYPGKNGGNVSTCLVSVPVPS
jgi:hypothetical protein